MLYLYSLLLLFYSIILGFILTLVPFRLLYMTPPLAQASSRWSVLVMCVILCIGWCVFGWCVFGWCVCVWLVCVYLVGLCMFGWCALGDFVHCPVLFYLQVGASQK